jgi:hypothetical protein
MSVYAIVLTLAIAVSASAVILQPGPDVGKDTYISSSAPNVNYGDLWFMYVGDSGGTVLQTLIQFVEVDDYIGDTIDTATLSLYFIADEGSAPGVTLYMAKITEDWIESGEGGVTWNTVPDYEATFYTYDYPTATYPGAWVDFDVTDIVSDWLDGSSDNYGLILYTDDNRNHNGYADTCEYSEPNYRPKLEFFNTTVESSSLGGIKAAFK